MALLLHHGFRMSWSSSTLRSVKLRRGFLLAPLVGHPPPEESETVRRVRASPLLGRCEERQGVRVPPVAAGPNPPNGGLSPPAPRRCPTPAESSPLARTRT